MLDVSDMIKVNGDKFTLTEDLTPDREVQFKTIWRDKEWFFQGHIGKDKRNVHIMMMQSL